jgi:hypothetical protein
MENKTNKPTISKSQFIADVNSGMSKSELTTKWGISSQSVKQLATQFGLTIKRAVTPKYILVDDTAIETNYTQQELTFESLESTTALNN